MLGPVIQELVRSLTAGAPAPRALPYLGLDHATGTAFHLLDALSARGIFRKYEHVLHIGAELGGVSRWLAVRRGCDVVGTTTTAVDAHEGNELTRRAGLRSQVRLVPARAEALPVRGGQFTHVWLVDGLSRSTAPAGVLAEAFRAVRPGGTLAVQDLLHDPEREAPTPAAGRPATLASRVHDLETTGFVDIEISDRTDEATEHLPRVIAARAQLRLRLLASGDAGLLAIVRERDEIDRALAADALRVVQILARRPA